MQARRRRRVKIIATLGPASNERETIAALFAAGADVFRINMSHASHDAMRERVAMIRSLEEEMNRPIGILVDLQGPKLRLGAFDGGRADLHKGDLFVLDGDPAPGGPSRVYLPIPKSSARSRPAIAFSSMTARSCCASPTPPPDARRPLSKWRGGYRIRKG